MTRKIPALLLLWFAMMGGFVPGATAEPPPAARAPSLYTRLGLKSEVEPCDCLFLALGIEVKAQQSRFR